jgi:hypothetical protein
MRKRFVRLLEKLPMHHGCSRDLLASEPAYTSNG